MDRQAFRDACAHYATGITVATVVDGDGRPHGLTANSFTSVSWDPPLVLVCVDHRATVYRHFYASESFAINILTEAQKDVSVRFATAEDRFDGIVWQPGIAGSPLLEGALAQLECRTVHRYLAGDHTIFVGEVIRAASIEGRPLVYYLRHYRKLPD